MANDYISKADAVSRISDLLVFELKMTRCPTWNEVYNAIGELPSADVVQVVRCKDCKYHSYDEEFCCYWCEHTFMAGEVKPNFYCACGEE